MRRALRVTVLIGIGLMPLAVILVARAAIDFLPSDVPEPQWRWSRGPDSTLARTEVAAARAAGAIYVIGGFVPPDRTTAIVERYDLTRRRWTRVRPLPVPLNHAAAAGYNGHVYVLGGYAGANGLTQAVATLYRYDPKPDRWVKLPPAPTARAALAFGAIKGRLYAAGGSDGRRAMARLEIYDIRKRHWARGPQLSVAREHLGGAVVEGELYAIGGRNGAQGNLRIAERFTPGARHWVRLPDLLEARGGNGAAGSSSRSEVYAVGGEEAGGTIGEVDAWGGFIPRRGWYRLPDLPTPRHGLGVVFDPVGDRLYVLEGGTSPGFSFSRRLEILSDVRARD